MGVFILSLLGAPLLASLLMPGRLSPRWVGGTYVACGFLTDACCQALMVEGGRVGMVRLAIAEALCFAPGWLVLGAGLATRPRSGRPSVPSDLGRGFAWGIWVMLLPAMGLVVLNRLPP